ncbi:Metallo-dependent phosphatase-like protein [Mycotypha africana]|uniref:Metallo-dependent phosphatase-like protein n=1 Tax=Mycotypha africana TaxID=64632 RepID=UPI00230009CF|nr:Metallo-dependent phosphatase-like protein [Mycotypha africana]KAI8977591.1 Metallo-dependent phosphatase-like protein [Mycotypha africana]
MWLTKDDDSSEYVAAVPKYFKSDRQKKLWKWIAIGVAAVIIIVIVVVVAVVVTENKRKSSSNNTASDGINTANGRYPISPYSHITLMKTFNGTSTGNNSRVFVIGDVHGCLDDLNALVTKINYNPANDKIILAGDIVAKGPDSVGVIRRAKELGAYCVRGNHDDKVLRLKSFEMQHGRKAMFPLDATMPEGNVPDPIKFKNYHAAIALNMTKEDYEYLVNCPVILHLPNYNDTVVVHAGVDPNLKSLEDQIPYLVMNMRNIYNSVPTPEKDVGIQWAQEWNSLQKNLVTNYTNVFYGHDSSRGLNIQAYTFGLDTGCVEGKELTAMEISTREVTQVKCSAYLKHYTEQEDII